MRPASAFLSDLALVAVIIPGELVIVVLFATSGASWQEWAAFLALEALMVSLVLLAAFYLNRWLRYRLDRDAVLVRGMLRWITYDRS